MSLTINQVSKVYGKKVALNQLSLELEDGKIYGLIGRNGAGKTTLLSIASAQNSATDGEVLLDGKKVWENDEALKDICFSREIATTATDSRNTSKVCEYLRIASILYPNWNAELADELITEFGLDRKMRMNKLSKGMQSMVTIIVALASGARAGTAISAEIANMQVTSQVDAIKTLKISPVGYYFTPRILASAITVPMVVLIAEFIGILGGMFVALGTINLHPARYAASAWAWIATKDIYISLLKACIFGALIALVCATKGYETKGGAKEVGTSTTQAAILSTIYMLIADFLINLLFYIS